HCVGEPGEFTGMRIFTESDVKNGNNNFPFAGPNTVEAASWQAHPLFTESAFFLHDVGVIRLTEPVQLAAEQYGRLPTVNQLDALQPGNATQFTTVGYGATKVTHFLVQKEFVRISAEPHLIQINTPFTGPSLLLLSSNAATGGQCYGDSGGPSYLGSSNVIAGVSSFGINPNCVGTGGVFRLDRQDVLDFVTPFLN
ncbi:MAG TPA: trypsin-like serine protease, partial [Gemmatimonadaceae bacterium]